MKILVRRKGAFGDVILVTPIVARLRKQYPDAQIWVETDYPDVFAGNRHVAGAGRSCPGPFDLVIDLNGAYERRLRRGPVVDAYMEEAFGDPGDGYEVTLARGTVPAWLNHLDWSKVITINPARSWPQRTLPLEWWRVFCAEMRSRSYSAVSVGTTQDWPMDGDAIDTRSRLSLAEQVAVIEASAAFVGSESGPLNMAQATSRPIIALMTMGDPEQIRVWRNGAADWGFYPIMADVPCVGCSKEITEPVTFFPCRLGTNECVRSFDVTKVADATCAAISRHQERVA